MKRIICIVCFIIVLCINCGTSVFCATVEQEAEYICKDSFLKQYHSAAEYQEMYAHYTGLGGEETIDWVFVFARKQFEEPMSRCQLVGERILFTDSGYYPFTFGYCIYDVESDMFKGLTEIITTGDVNNYEGLLDYWESLELGVPLGDADNDGMLSVLDATYIQMVIAKLCEFNGNDDLRDYIFVGVDYISDFDRDGERTILDATAIQIKLAGLNE